MNTDSINRRAELVATRQHHAEQLDRDREFLATADASFAVLGLGAAPRRQPGQTVAAHRAAIADQALTAVADLPHMRREWLAFNTDSIARCDAAGATATTGVLLAQAVEAYAAPVGELRESVTRDTAGREIHKFYGDPEACWSVFKQKPRIVASWQTPRGAEAARATPGHLMPDGSFRASRL
jgi:hypothetical protein